MWNRHSSIICPRVTAPLFSVLYAEYYRMFPVSCKIVLWSTISAGYVIFSCVFLYLDQNLLT